MCLLWVSSFPDSVEKFKLLFTSSKLYKMFLSSIDVVRELLLIRFFISLLISIWVKSQNGFSNFHNSRIASIKFFANCFKPFLFRASLFNPICFSQWLHWWSFLFLTAIAVVQHQRQHLMLFYCHTFYCHAFLLVLKL